MSIPPEPGPGTIPEERREGGTVYGNLTFTRAASFQDSQYHPIVYQENNSNAETLPTAREGIVMEGLILGTGVCQLKRGVFPQGVCIPVLQNCGKHRPGAKSSRSVSPRTL